MAHDFLIFRAAHTNQTNWKIVWIFCSKNLISGSELSGPLVQKHLVLLPLTRLRNVPTPQWKHIVVSCLLMLKCRLQLWPVIKNYPVVSCLEMSRLTDCGLSLKISNVGKPSQTSVCPPVAVTTTQSLPPSCIIVCSYTCYLNVL